MTKIGFVIQARMGSARLPAKVLSPLQSGPRETLLDKIVDVLIDMNPIAQIVLATSEELRDDPLEEFAKQRGIHCVRGSEEDVLERFSVVVRQFGFEHVVRLTGDNPFIDKKYLQKTLAHHLAKEADYTHSVGLPLGMNVEVIKSSALLQSDALGKTSADREHVTFFARQHPNYFHLGEYQVELAPELSTLRLTVDTPQDLALAKALFQRQRALGTEMNLDFILRVYAEQPSLFGINKEVEQKNPEYELAKRPLLLFRADGNSQMGLGHLYRSAALANMLKPIARCGLVNHGSPVPMLDDLQRHFEFVEQLSTDDVQDFIEAFEKKDILKDSQVVVLDGYHFTTDVQRALLAAGKRLVCIDDIHSYEFLADVIINHSPVNNLVEKYKREAHTALALGLDFALLRAPFLSVARRQHKPEKRGHFYVSFGGSDSNNISTQLIRWLTELGYTHPIDVVLGAANVFRAAVEKAAEKYPGTVTIHQNLADEAMIDLYQKARLAFLPASTTLLEALACRVPIVTGFYVDNQVDIYHGFMEKRLLAGVGDWNEPHCLRQAIEQCLSVDIDVYQRQARHLIDGYSNVNLSLVFHQLLSGEEPLVCRTARTEDVVQYFNWVNDPLVRSTAINTDPIAWEEHVSWFGDRVNDENCLLLFFSLRNVPCGQVRFQIDGGHAVVSISIDPRYRGKKLATRMLRIAEYQLRSRYSSVSLVSAFIRPDNIASQKSFKHSGFYFVLEETQQGTQLLRYQRSYSEE